MSRSVEFAVRGLPTPQGSPVAFIAGGKARVVSGAQGKGSHGGGLHAWRTAIATEARAAIEAAPLLEGPLSVRATFTLPRPKGHYLPANRSRAVPELRVDAPDFHAGKPDLDKLARSLLDALKNVVWHDDSQVARVAMAKLYSETPGVVVHVETLA